MINDTVEKRKCSEIVFNDAKKLTHKLVLLEEIKTKIQFTAYVVDHCFEDQKGIIVSFKNNPSFNLKCNNILQTDKKDIKELDLRNIFNGEEFLFLGIVYNNSLLN